MKKLEDYIKEKTVKFDKKKADEIVKKHKKLLDRLKDA